MSFGLRHFGTHLRSVVAHTAVTVLAGAALSATGTSVASAQPGVLPCAPGNERYCEAQVGDLVSTSLHALLPTQPSLGYDEVFTRLGRYTAGKDSINHKFHDWCEANGQGKATGAQPGATLTDAASFTCEVAVGTETPDSIDPMKTAVVGPGGQLYLTDGHHTLTSFWEAPGGGPSTPIRLKVTGNLSDLTPDAFWDAMRANAWTWLQDADGMPITPAQLPKSLGLSQFGNDVNRGVLYFVRDIGYKQTSESPAFQEFYWGQWMRDQTNPSLRPENFDLRDLPSYLTLVKNLGDAMVALADNTVVANGRTAIELGKLAAFDDSAFAHVSQPYSADKPGKLAYTLMYKGTH